MKNTESPTKDEKAYRKVDQEYIGKKVECKEEQNKTVGRQERARMHNLKC